MEASREWSRLLAWLAAAGMCLPLELSAAQDGARDAVPPSAPVSLVRDVELAYGGLLVGRFVDANGRPLAGANVSILTTSGNALASTRTDSDGVFAVARLRGGVHQITTADTVQLCRLWANGTAPPRSPQSVEVVAGSGVIRGQWGPPPGNHLIKKFKVLATNPFVIGGIAAAAVAIPIALSDDDGPHS